jgi:hypothetical protein
MWAPGPMAGVVPSIVGLASSAVLTANGHLRLGRAGIPVLVLTPRAGIPTGGRGVEWGLAGSGRFRAVGGRARRLAVQTCRPCTATIDDVHRTPNGRAT